MTKPFTLPLGSVSHGTLRTEDLLTACAKCLSHIIEGDHVRPFRDYQAHKLLLAECKYWANMCADPDFVETEDCADTLNDVIDLLNEYTPAYCYFGMHGGDGSDLGCWIDANHIESDQRYGIIVEVETEDELDRIADNTEYAMIEDKVSGALRIFKSTRVWVPEFASE